MRLEIERVSKRYRRGVRALSEVSLDLGPGVHGLLGPNGAGKSTLMRILATVTRPSSGQVRWQGRDTGRFPDELRRVVGYLPQDFGVYPNLDPIEFLDYLAAVKGIPKRVARERIDRLLEILNLTDVRKRRLGGFSGGMRQRVGIAQALLNDPHLLILDEPTAGLDPEERVRFRHLLMELAENRIVLLSTHIVSDLEATASAIALIRRGRLLRYASPEEILQTVEEKVWSLTVPSSDLGEARSQYLVSAAVRKSSGVQLRVVAAEAPLEAAVPVPPGLEDAYLHLLEDSRPDQEIAT